MGEAGDGEVGQHAALEHRPDPLHQAGVHRNEWFLPAAQSFYLTDLGPVVRQRTPIATGSLDVPPFDRDALIRALRTDQAGMSTFAEFLAAAWRGESSTTSPTPVRAASPASLARLTKREREAVALVALGLSNQDIATELVGSPFTVKTHITAP